MDTLPNEITSRVLSFLPVADRLRCSMVSKAWRRLAPSFWGVAADVLEHLNSFNACACSNGKLTFKGCNSCGEEGTITATPNLEHKIFKHIFLPQFPL
jgi:hypothetical protein